jgi:hypothetical protein
VGAFPQVRVVGLVECGTHATVKATMGRMPLGNRRWPVGCWASCSRGPWRGAAAGRPAVVGAELWRTATATGAELLWRAKTGKTAPKLPVDQVLSDGSWLSRLYAASDRRKRDPIVVRVVEYAICDPGRPQAKG